MEQLALEERSRIQKEETEKKERIRREEELKKVAEEEEDRTKKILEEERAAIKARDDAEGRRLELEQAKSAAKARVIEEERAKFEHEKQERQRKLVDAQNKLQLATADANALENIALKTKHHHHRKMDELQSKQPYRGLNQSVGGLSNIVPGAAQVAAPQEDPQDVINNAVLQAAGK